MRGMSDKDEFCPDDPVTRGQIARSLCEQDSRNGTTSAVRQVSATSRELNVPLARRSAGEEHEYLPLLKVETVDDDLAT